jgi:three-Cys-motif partner protein
LVDSIRFDVFFIDLSLVTCVPAAFFVAMIAPAFKYSSSARFLDSSPLLEEKWNTVTNAPISNGVHVSACVIVGECNVQIQKIVDQIPHRALTLVFIDPEGLHIHFETLRTLTTNRRVDLAILLPDGMDIVRNVETTYEKQTESKLDRFLGPNSKWRADWQNLTNRTPENKCQLFANIYKSQLREELGYIAFSDKIYKSGQTPIYRIIYASKHELGKKFFEDISKIDSGGQKQLF